MLCCNSQKQKQLHKKEATIDKLNEKLKAAIDDREGSHQMSADVAVGTAGDWEIVHCIHVGQCHTRADHWADHLFGLEILEGDEGASQRHC